MCVCVGGGGGVGVGVHAIAYAYMRVYVCDSRPLCNFTTHPFSCVLFLAGADGVEIAGTCTPTINLFYIKSKPLLKKRVIQSMSTPISRFKPTSQIFLLNR